jgi:hypothetical protein
MKHDLFVYRQKSDVNAVINAVALVPRVLADRPLECLCALCINRLFLVKSKHTGKDRQRLKLLVHQAVEVYRRRAFLGAVECCGIVVNSNGKIVKPDIKPRFVL